MTLSLICPHDRHPLSEIESGLSCAERGRQYAIQDGVVCTLDPDDFYEGAYENQVRCLPRGKKPWHAWPLWLINSGYLWTMRRFIPPGATVVQLGCAGGMRLVRFTRNLSLTVMVILGIKAPQQTWRYVKTRLFGWDMEKTWLQSLSAYTKLAEFGTGGGLGIATGPIALFLSLYSAHAANP